MKFIPNFIPRRWWRASRCEARILFPLCFLLFSSSLFPQARYGGFNAFSDTGTGGIGSQRHFHELYDMAFTNRFRKLGDKYLDLQPWFTWKRQQMGGGRWSSSLSVTRTNPLPDWRYLQLKVTAVWNGGLLGTSGGPDNIIFLRNHPATKSAIDRQILQLVAAKLPDPISYLDIYGGRHTVEQFDYGLPFDPQQRLREVQQKNPKEAKR